MGRTSSARVGRADGEGVGFFSPWLTVVAWLAAALSVAGCGSPQETASATPCPPGERCKTNVTFLHTADIHSRLFPYDLLITQADADLGLGATGELANVGGVARMAYVVARERARASRVLHVEGGDCFQGAPVFNFFQGEPELRALGQMGVDAMTLANHEFDLGVFSLGRQLQQWGSVPPLVANYKFDPPELPNTPPLATLVRPFQIFTLSGLRVAVIGMGNLSTLTSIFEQPNRLGILPLRTYEVAQAYIDVLRPHVDLVVATTHLGLEVDEAMIHRTTGLDIVFGSHNHIVLNPPKVVLDCSADLTQPGYVWAQDPNLPVNPGAPPPNDELHPDPRNHPWEFQRKCTPRSVLLVHSGAFAKYVGRLDVVVSNEPKDASPTGRDVDYDPVDGFEVVSSRYDPIPITADVPAARAMTEMLEPYAQRLDVLADLNNLVGYAPRQLQRNAPGGGDSPLGNLIARAMWLRLGVQTDFSMTNSLGIRQDLLPGPLTVEQLYNIFPFDNSITKMQLSGKEVQELFDFNARRSAGRGCRTQVQVAGARAVVSCSRCSRPLPCATDNECPGDQSGSCDLSSRTCKTTGACTEFVYIGTTEKTCRTDTDCVTPDGTLLPNACNKSPSVEVGRCMAPIIPTNVYELATSNYIAQGGSGFRVLQRNTTQLDTRIQQRDALADYLRQAKPCGFDPTAETPEGLVACESDADCPQGTDGSAGFVCSCPQNATGRASTAGAVTCSTQSTCPKTVGRCVLRRCRDDVATFRNTRCKNATDKAACSSALDPCTYGGESCKVLACVDASVGAETDDRLRMVSQ